MSSQLLFNCLFQPFPLVSICTIPVMAASASWPHAHVAQIGHEPASLHTPKPDPTRDANPNVNPYHERYPTRNPNSHVTVLSAPSERQAVRTAGVTTAVYDGFEVLYTRSTADSMRLFVQLTAAIQARCFSS